MPFQLTFTEMCQAVRAFTASLANMTQEEIRKAKLLCIKNAIERYKVASRISALFLIWVGTISILMFFNSIQYFFLFALLPILFFFVVFSCRKVWLKASKNIIINALELWREDLGDDYIELTRRLGNVKGNK